MYNVFSGVKYLLKSKRLYIDQSIFRLHYKFTFFLLLASGALIGSKQYAGEPIKCTPDTHEYSAVVDIYCFITSTYTVKSALNKTLEDGAPNPGIYHSQDKKDHRYHIYYQWVGFVLFFQAILFYLPHWLWKNFEGGQITKLLEADESSSKDPEVLKLKRVNTIVKFLKNRWRRDKLYCYKYFFCEFLCLFNVIGQMFLLDSVFSHDFLYYGVEVIKYFYYGPARTQNPFLRIFPRVTSCTFHYFGEGGRIRKTSVLCVLAVNVINEKVFLFIWFWFVILIVLTLFALMTKLILFSSNYLRRMSLKFNFRSVNPRLFRFIIETGNSGDYLLIYLLGQNMDQSLFSDVIEEFVNRYDVKEC